VTTEDVLSGQAETLDLINTELTGRLARQTESGSKIDTKAIFLAGFAATATQFLATRHPQPLLATLAFAAYGVAIVSGTLTQALTKYGDVPRPRILLTQYGLATKEKTLVDLAVERVNTFEALVTDPWAGSSCGAAG
jgi:hypothetical protein